MHKFINYFLSLKLTSFRSLFLKFILLSSVFSTAFHTVISLLALIISDFTTLYILPLKSCSYNCNKSIASLE
ncbi:TPA: hypothetical protein DEG21_06205 [Patescibacteria group bacterium]|nr:hypothetical protein [Candidatus Gracilibacteria bacterium]